MPGPYVTPEFTSIPASSVAYLIPVIRQLDLILPWHMCSTFSTVFEPVLFPRTVAWLAPLPAVNYITN